MSERTLDDCRTCDGCGQVTISEDGDITPWTVWTSLPLESSSAVLLGLVRPVPCPDCSEQEQRDE